MHDSEPVTLGDLYNLLRMETAQDEYPPGRRVQVAIATFCIVRDHHLAIAILLDERLYASAFALVRPIYEAAVKGIWLANCATEAQAEQYAQGRELDGVGDLVSQLVAAKPSLPVSAQFQQVKSKYWRALSSLTHAGHAQVKRWMTPEGVGPTYTDKEIREIANFTAYVALVAAIERARLGNNQPAIKRIGSLFREIEPIANVSGSGGSLSPRREAQG